MPANSPFEIGHASLTWWAHLRPLAIESTGAGLGAAGVGLSNGPASTAAGALNGVERHVSKHQAALRVETCVRCLPADQRRMVFARYARGISVAAAARQLGLEDAKARSILRAAIESVGRDLRFRSIQAEKQRLAAKKLRKTQVGLDGIAKKAQDSLNVEKLRSLHRRRRPALSLA